MILMSCCLSQDTPGTFHMCRLCRAELASETNRCWLRDKVSNERNVGIMERSAPEIKELMRDGTIQRRGSIRARGGWWWWVRSGDIPVINTSCKCDCACFYFTLYCFYSTSLICQLHLLLHLHVSHTNTRAGDEAWCISTHWAETGSSMLTTPWVLLQCFCSTFSISPPPTDLFIYNLQHVPLILRTNNVQPHAAESPWPVIITDPPSLTVWPVRLPHIENPCVCVCVVDIQWPVY